MVNVLGGSLGSMASTTLGIEGIQEWRVITNTLSAEYGMTMGSQMTIVTKSGTNRFHGSLFEYLGTAFSTRATSTFVPLRRIGCRHSGRNNYGGSVGGPLSATTCSSPRGEGFANGSGITSIANTIPAQCRRSHCPSMHVPIRWDRTIAPLIKPLLAQFPLPNLPDNRVAFPFTQPTHEDFYQGRARLEHLRIRHGIRSADAGRDDAGSTARLPGFITDRLSRNRVPDGLRDPHLYADFAEYGTHVLQLHEAQSHVTGARQRSGIRLRARRGMGLVNISGIGEFGPRPARRSCRTRIFCRSAAT